MLEVTKITVRSFDPTKCRFFVYGLVDPRDGRLRYIGKSTTGMCRPRRHYNPSYVERTISTHKSCWVKSLLEKGLRPKICILQEFTCMDSLHAAEQEYISIARKEGHDLTNGTDGGPGTSGLRHSQEAKKKISAANLGSKRSQTTRSNISAGLLGHKVSAVTREKLSKYKTGRKNTQESKIKVSESLRGKSKPPEANRKAWETRRKLYGDRGHA